MASWQHCIDYNTTSARLSKPGNTCRPGVWKTDSSLSKTPKKGTARSQPPCNTHVPPSTEGLHHHGHNHLFCQDVCQRMSRECSLHLYHLDHQRNNHGLAFVGNRTRFLRVFKERLGIRHHESQDFTSGIANLHRLKLHLFKQVKTPERRMVTCGVRGLGFVFLVFVFLFLALYSSAQNLSFWPQLLHDFL